ncbi:MAG: HAD-IA family hydrolase [Zoogloeaceae bacterium]|jgi:phosphoglycolate phosphatase|nr:HAD-IA family hydrolase [Zoogloeaceae bacterium]
MPKFDLIVFDWDGTLMDSAATIVHAIQSASRDLGQPVPDDATARHVIGLGLEDALRHVAPNLPATQYPEMAERYRHHYFSRSHELFLFEGVRELLIELAEQGVTLAVATGKSQQGLDRALDHFGLRPSFQALRCADQCPSKPHPQMLFELMEELGRQPEHTLMIGDTTHDLQMAQNAGTASVGVSYGAHPAASLRALAPLVCVDSVAALRQFFRSQVSDDR